MTDENLIPHKSEGGFDKEGLTEASRVLIIGHGDLAVRQEATHRHWIADGIDVHCADIDSQKLEDAIDGVTCHDLSDPAEEAKMLAQGPYDLMLVNNFPGLHLVTALKYATHCKSIIIQKPQDLNFPLIRTIAHADGFADFRSKVKIHDHYRNKDAVPAFLRVLPNLHTDFGQFKRLIFFLTESRSVNDPREEARAGALKCGMIQDLAVHMFDLMLEAISLGTQWRNSKDDDRMHKRVGGHIEIKACPILREQSSTLGDDVETFAAIDMHVTELVDFPAGGKYPRQRDHGFDVLIVVGKGINIEQDVPGDLKAVVAEFERPNYDVTIDLVNQRLSGVQDVLPAGIQINRHHGGMNRPLMLLSPNPPHHASAGFGGAQYQHWQTLTFSEQVAANVDQVKRLTMSGVTDAYPPGRALGDFIRELATRTRQIRPIWGNFRPLTGYLSKLPRLDEYYD